MKRAQCFSVKILPFFLFSLLACTGLIIGSMSGLVIVGETSSNVTINFDGVEFPTPESDNKLNIELTNLSGDGVNIILTAKNSEAGTRTGKFPTGTYEIDGSNNQFQGNIIYKGTETTDIVGTGGYFKLNSFALGQTADGREAVLLIAGEFDVDLEEDGFVVGDFEKDFS